jgi:hypothetical protein
MYSTSSIPSDLAAVFNRFSNEELHQIGIAFIEQSQHHIDKQLLSRPTSSPQHRPLPSRPVQQNFPLIPPLMNHQQQQYISNVRPLMDEHQHTPITTSTPRRPATDSFDYSGDKHRRTTKRPRNNEQSPTVQLQQQQTQQQHQFLKVPVRAHNSFNSNVLKRAVTSNLPCFFIIFDPASDSTNTLSSTQVAIMLKKLFVDNHLSIKELSMCMQAGAQRFKFAVSDKIEFLNLFKFSWPDKIDGIKVEVIVPRSLPDCFSLVVRYIPVDIKEEDARKEVMKAIPAAISFSTISYQHRQRPSYDLRFSVRDSEQYQTALELGRLSIGHYYLPLTQFYMGYRLTYCTACWKLGHMRNQCHSPVCCRKCLVPYESGVKHCCSNDDLICAQCGGKHFSLDSVCPLVKHYKSDLKLAVDKALTDGTIKRTAPGETLQPFRRQDADFPVLNLPKVGGVPGWHDPPAVADVKQQQQQQHNLAKEVSELVKVIKTLSDTMIRIEKNVDEMYKRIEIQEKRSMLHSNSMITIIDTLKIMTKWVNANNSEKTKMKRNFNKVSEDLQNWKDKINLDKNDLFLPLTSSPHHPTTMSNNNKSNDGDMDQVEDLSMISPNHDV